MTTDSNFRCGHCDSEAVVIRERRAVPMGARRFEIEDEYLKCPSCGEQFYTPEQADKRQQRLVERARTEDNLLTPAKIKAIRESVGLTQRQFEQLLGVGEKTCVRWEQGRVCQNVATDRLIRLLAADRENIHRLAAINGIALPPAPTAPVAAPMSSLAVAAASPLRRQDLLRANAVSQAQARNIAGMDLTPVPEPNATGLSTPEGYSLLPSPWEASGESLTGARTPSSQTPSLAA